MPSVPDAVLMVLTRQQQKLNIQMKKIHQAKEEEKGNGTNDCDGNRTVRLATTG